MDRELIAENVESSITFNTEGEVVINEQTSASKKLTARRAIEAYKERKQLEQYLNDYYFSDDADV